MNYSIVYSSKSGNTALLAEKIRSALSNDVMMYCGSPALYTEDVEFVFAGFWTDKGNCDEDTALFLQGLRKKRVFLFGTAGFGGSEDYFEQILSRVQEYIDSSNEVVGSYMCQGKMPASVRSRYEAMRSAGNEKAVKLLENFDSALSHPDAADLERLRNVVSEILQRG